MPTRNEHSLCSLVQFTVNKSGELWASRLEAMTTEELLASGAVVRRVVNERRIALSTGCEQRRLPCLMQMAIDQAVLDWVEAKLREREQEREALALARRRIFDDFKGSSADLLKQVKCFTVLDGEDIRLSDLSTKLARLELSSSSTVSTCRSPTS